MSELDSPNTESEEDFIAFHEYGECINQTDGGLDEAPAPSNSNMTNNTPINSEPKAVVLDLNKLAYQLQQIVNETEKVKKHEAKANKIKAKMQAEKPTENRKN